MCPESDEHTDWYVGVKKSFGLYHSSGRFGAVELLFEQSTDRAIEYEYAYVATTLPASSS